MKQSSPPSDPRRMDAGQPGAYYGHGLPYLPLGDYPGKIIAIEGTDGVGRSTQIQMLREWLEVRGYGVIETGWTRSALMQPTIDIAKASNTLNKLTFVLLYATDFADRLEKESPGPRCAAWIGRGSAACMGSQLPHTRCSISRSTWTPSRSACWSRAAWTIGNPAWT
jgi:hypothetical protein